MDSYIVKVSPKGQITLPVKERAKSKYKRYLLEVSGKVFILKPIEIKILGEDQDETKDFSSLAASTFDFWNNEQDDIYQKFYNK